METLFETRHIAGTAMAYHRHELAYVTVVLEGLYTEVFDDSPRTYRRGAVIVHRPHEEHADHFSDATRCLNTEIAPEDSAASVLQRLLESGASVGLEQLQKAFAREETPLPRWLDNVVESGEWVQPIPLRHLAERCGVHQTHFSREFRRYMGTTPSDHRRRARVDLASKLLLKTDRTLAHVAIACGFTDQSHLNRAFAIELGLSPGQYRRAFTR